MEHVVSKSEVFNNSIQRFKEYRIGINTEYDMLCLLNKLEAHEETLEDIDKFTSYAYRMINERTKEEAADFVSGTNAFFSSWNELIEFSCILDDEKSIDDARERILFELKFCDYVLTTDGIVETDIV